jgi:hypothetical protein
MVSGLLAAVHKNNSIVRWFCMNAGRNVEEQQRVSDLTDMTAEVYGIYLDKTTMRIYNSGNKLILCLSYLSLLS